MNTDVDNLKSFIEKIRSLNFFQHLFKWSISNDLIELRLYWNKNAPDERRGRRKCLHNGIILIVICFGFKSK